MLGHAVLLSWVALSLAGRAAAEETLGIKVTLGVVCDRKTHNGDEISVDYRGTLTNGEEFDSSYGDEPFTFDLGAGQVIKGWDLGLLDMCIGEKRNLTLPPAWAYGNRTVGPIPANSTLLFETELVGITGVPKPSVIVTTPLPSAT